MMRLGSPQLKRSAALLLLGTLLIGTPGCTTVRTKKEPVAKANLFITRGPKETQLQWKSQAGVLYTIMAKPRHARATSWAPIQDARNIRGTGGTMIYTDHPRRGMEKSYRLHLVPMRRSSR